MLLGAIGQHHGARRLRRRARRRWSTTRSSTSRTSCGACARHARRRARRSTARDHPRRVARGARRDLARDADHRAGGAAGVLHGRACPAPSSSRWRSPSCWRCWRRCSSPHRDAGALPDPARSLGDRAAASRRWCRGCKRHYDAALERVISAPRADLRHRGWHRRDRRRRVCRCSGSALLPSFKERDFLMHWVTARRHVAPGDVPDHAARQPRAAGDSGRAPISAPISAARSAATSPMASTSPRTGSASIRDADLRQDAGAHRGDGRGLSRPLSRRADLPARTDQGGADGRGRVDRRAHLRPRAARRCAAKAERVVRRLKDIPGSSTCTSSSRSTSRRSQVRVESRRGGAATA